MSTKHGLSLKPLAIVGERATIVAFEGLGLSAFPVDNVDEARRIVASLIRKKQYAIVFVTEDIGKHIEDVIAESLREPEPSVVLVPSSSGSQQIGLKKLSQVLKRALGRDILRVE
ncbi:MAG: V-type ATP synthase subunit F [bacterium]